MIASITTMKIVTVLPLQKSVFKDSLTYFSSKELKPGAIVEAPLGNRSITGLVTELTPAESMKSALRGAEFELKKITRVIHESFFLPEFIESCKKTSNFYATTTGQVIEQFVPKAILESPDTATTFDVAPLPAEAEHDLRLKPEVCILQESDTERISLYKSLIRESFARKTSVFFCLPTLNEIERVAEAMGKGISDYTVILHSGLSKKKLLTEWQRALNPTHPILIIATPTFLSLPRRDIKLLIVDRESSSSYKRDGRPFVDSRQFAITFAKELRMKIILGDLLLRSETIQALKEGIMTGLFPLKYRAFSEVTGKLFTSGTKDAEGKKLKFRAITPELETEIRQIQERDEQLLFITGRRGISPTTICSDCERVLSCPTCSSPLVLHKQMDDKEDGETIFMCHKCNEIKEVEDTCPHCGSWRLAVLGIGIERIAVELEKIIDPKKIFILDSDTAKTVKEAREIVATFKNTSAGVLLGTEMALQHFHDQIPNTAVAGIDGLFTIPDFRINEKIFSLLLRTRARATRQFFIQTRYPDTPIFDYAIKGNLLDFYREEIEERKRFNYPPFSIMLKISLSGKRHTVLASMERLKQHLSKYEPALIPPSNEPKGMTTMHLILRLDKAKWPDVTLLETLKTLPPSFTIDVNPESLL